MSSQDPPPSSLQRRAASQDADPDQRQKRRRVDDVDQPSSVLTQISTWEIPPDVVLDPVEKSPIELSDSDDPIAPAPASVATPEPLSAYTCPICFSPPTNATLTPCGHICCGLCLFTAVKSTIRRNMAVAMDRAPPPRSFRCFQWGFPAHLYWLRCPVCRAEIPGWDGRGGGVIGLKIQVLYSL